MVSTAECANQGGQHTAAAGDPGHGGTSVSKNTAFRTIGNHIDFAGDGNNASQLSGQFCCHGNRSTQILFGNLVQIADVHTAAGGLLSCQIADLRGVAPNGSKMNLLQQSFHCVPPQLGATRTHGIENNRRSQPVCFLACQDHGIHTINSTQVTHQCLYLTNCFLHFQRVAGHGGTAA